MKKMKKKEYFGASLHLGGLGVLWNKSHLFSIAYSWLYSSPGLSVLFQQFFSHLFFQQKKSEKLTDKPLPPLYIVHWFQWVNDSAMHFTNVYTLIHTHAHWRKIPGIHCFNQAEPDQKFGILHCSMQIHLTRFDNSTWMFLPNIQHFFILVLVWKSKRKSISVGGNSRFLD